MSNRPEIETAYVLVCIKENNQHQQCLMITEIFSYYTKSVWTKSIIMSEIRQPANKQPFLRMCN